MVFTFGLKEYGRNNARGGLINGVVVTRGSTVNSSKGNFIVSTTNRTALSRGYKPRIVRTDLSDCPLLWQVTLNNLKLLGRVDTENYRAEESWGIPCFDENLFERPPFTGKRWNRLDCSADVLCVVTRDDKTAVFYLRLSR